MKKITISVVVSEALHRQWQDLPPARNAELNAALVETLQRVCEPRADAGAAVIHERRLPQSGNTGWGEAWSRRWNDLEAQRFAKLERDSPDPHGNDEPPSRPAGK
jgi:hypothetical protein